MSDQTIEQFGEQWSRFGNTTEGFFGSTAVLQDICGPLLTLADFRGRRAVEIGSGNGRIVNMLAESGVARIVAVEPSGGIEVLKENTRKHADRIEYLQVKGEDLPARPVDLALSIGVLHHIEDPLPTVRRVFEVLEPGGRFLVWVYGKENNGAYILFAESLRTLTRVVPDLVLAGIAHVLTFLLGVYVALCRFLPLPLADYMRNVMAKFDRRKRYFLVFDQLNCDYARYYDRKDAEALLARAGFQNVRLYHRHQMSWTILGEKPGSSERPC
jgi:SAM-dependent methyltransferase